MEVKMITKITKINNLAVFKDFEWDKVVRDSKGNNISKFTKVNIIYGRNYSGKTTLSRIVRSLETKKLSEKYESPDFGVEFDSNYKITLKNIEKQKQIICVFNVKQKRKQDNFCYRASVKKVARL